MNDLQDAYSDALIDPNPDDWTPKLKKMHKAMREIHEVLIMAKEMNNLLLTPGMGETIYRLSMQLRIKLADLEPLDDK